MRAPWPTSCSSSRPRSPGWPRGSRAATTRTLSKMPRPAKLSRALIQLLLVLFSVAFVIPFVWLVSTSLKPIEQTLSLPLTFIPRAYFAELGGKRMEVTLDFQVTQRGAVVRYDTGENAGKMGFLGAAQLAGGPAPYTVIHPVEAGSWHVTQRVESRLAEGGPSPIWDVIPRDQV